MNLPQNWNNMQATNFCENVKPKADGYKVKILKAEETTSSNGRPMLLLYIDIAYGTFKDNFLKLYNNKVKENPAFRWPSIYRQCFDEKGMPYFKGLITAIEESNQGFKFNGNCASLVNKFVGCIYKEKFIDQQNTKSIIEPAFVCSTARIDAGAFTIPSPVMYEPSKNQSSGVGGFGGNSQPNSFGTDQNPFGASDNDGVPF